MWSNMLAWGGCKQNQLYSSLSWVWLFWFNVFMYVKNLNVQETIQSNYYSNTHTHLGIPSPINSPRRKPEQLESLESKTCKSEPKISSLSPYHRKVVSDEEWSGKSHQDRVPKNVFASLAAFVSEINLPGSKSRKPRFSRPSPPPGPTPHWPHSYSGQSHCQYSLG